MSQQSHPITNPTRTDGRSSKTLRPLSCELASLKSCDGSATWKSGNTSVLASVHGPIAPRLAHQENAQEGVVSVVIKSGVATDTYEREWEAFLTSILTAAIIVSEYPRSVISITLQILNGDGSVLGSALHAAVSALMDAGISMNFLPTAVTCHVSSNGGFRLDPTAQEETTDGVLVLVFASQSLLGSYTVAPCRQSTQTFLDCCQEAVRAVPAVQAFWRLVMEQKATRESQTLWSI